MDNKAQITFRSYETKLGTHVLKKIQKQISTPASKIVQIKAALKKMESDTWDPSKTSLRDFTASFSEWKSVLSTMKVKPTSDQYKSWWINLLPPQFHDAQYQLIMDMLPPHWSDIDEVTDLADATQIEIATRNLTFKAIPKLKPKTDIERTPRGPPRGPPDAATTPSIEYPPRADDSRSSMPTQFSTSKDFMIHVKNEATNGKTRAQMKTQFSTPIGQGCWLCRFKQDDNAFHLDTTCKILNNVFAYSFSLGDYISTVSQPAPHKPQVISSSKKTIPSPTVAPTSPTAVVNMCYDTGTFPSTLCDQPSFFSSISAYDSPKFISLGDEKSLIPALGHGTLDYVIDEKYRMQEEAILTSCTPVALKSAASHIKHDNCSITGEKNTITITYPTFSHTVQASEHFEFPITPGANSSLPVLWSPSTAALCQPAKPPTLPPVTKPILKSKKQRLFNKKMALVRAPLDLR
jgi:hypothetical protein